MCLRASSAPAPHGLRHAAQRSTAHAADSAQTGRGGAALAIACRNWRQRLIRPRREVSTSAPGQHTGAVRRLGYHMAPGPDQEVSTSALMGVLTRLVMTGSNWDATMRMPTAEGCSESGISISLIS